MAGDSSQTSQPTVTEVLKFFGDEVILLENLYGLWRELSTSHSADAELAYEILPAFTEYVRWMAAEKLVVVMARLLESRSHDSVTLDYILESCRCKRDDIQERVDQAAKEFRTHAAAVMAHRHKRVVHTDRKLAFTKDGWLKLPSGNDTDLERAIFALADIHSLLDGDHTGQFVGYNWREQGEHFETINSGLDGGAGVFLDLLHRYDLYWNLTYQEHKLSDEQIVKAVRTGNIQQVLNQIENIHEDSSVEHC